MDYFQLYSQDSREQFLDMSDTRSSPQPPPPDDEIDLSRTAEASS